jgi:hypothetical protein
LFGDEDGELRVGHLRLLIIGNQDRGRSHNIVIKELGELSSLQGRHDQRGKLDRVSFSVTDCKAETWTGVELEEVIADLGRSYDSDTMKKFLVNGGAFTAHRLRVYIHSLYNRVVTDILVRIQLI